MDTKSAWESVRACVCFKGVFIWEVVSFILFWINHSLTLGPPIIPCPLSIILLALHAFCPSPHDPPAPHPLPLPLLHPFISPPPPPPGVLPWKQSSAVRWLHAECSYCALICSDISWPIQSATWSWISQSGCGVSLLTLRPPPLLGLLPTLLSSHLIWGKMTGSDTWIMIMLLTVFTKED